MTPRQILKDAYENGHAYKVIITFNGGKTFEASYLETTPKAEGIANAFKASHVEDTDLEGATVSIKQNPAKEGWKMMKLGPRAHVYKDGKEVAVMTPFEYFKSEYYGKEGYTRKIKQEVYRP